MKISKFQASEERLILMALCVHDGILGSVYRHLKKDHEPFRSKWSNLVAGWCFKHYNKYAQAPRKALQSIFIEWSQDGHHGDTIGLVESFLEGLSGEYKALAEEINEAHTMDLAGVYFEKVRLEKLAEEIQASLHFNELAEAKQALAEFEPIDFSSKTWADPFESEEVKETFRFYEEDRTLIHFPGDLDRFLSPHFERDGFVALVGPEKRGKSFWLQEIVVLGLRQRRRVLYYVLGDMSKVQIKRRLYVRSAGKPLKAARLIMPRELTVSKEGEVDLRTAAVEYEALSAKDVHRKRDELLARTATKQLRLKLKCSGGGMISAGDIEQDVANFAKEGWDPDLVVLDYADELAPEQNTLRLDKRHQINENWRVLRRIGLNHHCLVVTATQAAARTYEAKTLHKGGFSESKTKNAHVTGLLGLNQIGDEKRQGIYRLNWILLRDGAWAENQVIYTAGNLALGCPCMKSFLP